MITKIREHLEQLERELLNPETRRNGTRLEELLAPDFREVGASGRSYDRPGIVLELLREEPLEIAIEELRCELLSHECAMLTYRSRRKSDLGAHPVCRISVWVVRECRWQMLYHQGTRQSKA